jgi:hypothetical protein
MSIDTKPPPINFQILLDFSFDWGIFVSTAVDTNIPPKEEIDTKLPPNTAVLMSLISGAINTFMKDEVQACIHPFLSSVALDTVIIIGKHTVLR